MLYTREIKLVVVSDEKKRRKSTLGFDRTVYSALDGDLSNCGKKNCHVNDWTVLPIVRGKVKKKIDFDKEKTFVLETQRPPLT